MQNRMFHFMLTQFFPLLFGLWTLLNVYFTYEGLRLDYSGVQTQAKLVEVRRTLHAPSGDSVEKRGYEIEFQGPNGEIYREPVSDKKLLYRKAEPITIKFDPSRLSRWREEPRTDSLIGNVFAIIFFGALTYASRVYLQKIAAYITAQTSF
jgi:hypothetical protein